MASLRAVGALALSLAAVPSRAQDTDPTPIIGDAARKALVVLMRENRQKYGDDATIMQGLLMMHAVQTDAVLATESQIRGFEEREGRRFLAFRVGSGVVFNDRKMDRNGRLRTVWQGILERSLLRYQTFSVPADGVMVEVEYTHRPYADLSDLYRTIEDEGAKERAKFYLLTTDLSEFVARRLNAQDLLGRSKVLCDEEPVTIDLLLGSGAAVVP